MSQSLLGFDIGGTKCAVLVGSAVGDQISILERISFATESGSEANLVRLETLARDLLKRHQIELPSGIGISCGGPLDSRAGVIQCPPNLPGWIDVPIVERFTKAFGVPVQLQNDANAGALAEWKWGAGRGTQNLVFLTFGTGMGAGLILDGRLYSGSCDLAGEVGHLRLAEEGPVGFGKKGSFEGFCSGGGISRLAQMRGFKGTAREVFEAAHRGEALALEIVQTVARRLGQGLALLVDVLNPEVIVIGSIFARQRDLLWPEAERVLREEAIPASFKAVRVVPAELGEQIGDYAALVLALRASER